MSKEEGQGRVGMSQRSKTAYFLPHFFPQESRVAPKDLWQAWPQREDYSD